jgi:hypothetical protein
MMAMEAVIANMTHSFTDVEASLITMTEFMIILKRLKSGKSDGNIGLFSDHIIHGTQKLFDILVLLFNSMIIHCISPADMLTGTMVPIPKGKRCDTSCSDNFRGICLQSLLCKLLDIFMMSREADTLHTSDAQFGFKEGHSANMAASIVTETVDYYHSRGGTVYALALDASKAFDRVEFYKLFMVLIERKFNPLYLRLLFYMYSNQRIRVKYNGSYSDYFDVNNGVKQGGVISPTLFTCYVDGLLKRLKDSGLGCRVGSAYLGSISYADDLMLLAPNISSLKSMISICESYADEYKIKFNGSKSMLMILDKKMRKHDVMVSVAGEPVEVTSNIKYLGHVLFNDRSNPHTDYIKKDFVMKVNSFLGEFSSLSSELKQNLFDTYCTSYYGSHLSDFSQINNLSVEWRKAVRRVWKIPRRTHSRFLPHIAQTLPIHVILQQNFIKYFYNGLQSDNNLVNFIFRNAICSNTRIGCNLNVILGSLCLNSCSVLSYNPNLLCRKLCNNWWNDCKEQDIRYGAHIREVVFMRDSSSESFLSASQYKDIIHHLCTS